MKRPENSLDKRWSAAELDKSRVELRKKRIAKLE